MIPDPLKPMRLPASAFAAAAGFALFGARAPVPCFAETPSVSSAAVPAPLLRLVPPDRWPAFKDEFGKDSIRKAAALSLEYLRKHGADRPFPRVAGRALSADELEASTEEFARVVEESKSGEQFAARLRREFDLYESVGSDGEGKVVFSSYYVPTYPASLRRGGVFRYPLYRWPPDLVVGDLGLFDPTLKGRSIVGRVAGDGTLVPYYDRREIDADGVLSGKNLEIAWLADSFDRFDVHFEGSGILTLEDGRRLLARHTITNGLKYRSVGLSLIDDGILKKTGSVYDQLMRYFKEHPEKEEWALEKDPRYVFFELVPVPGDGETFGRIQGAWTMPLTAGRSIAIDPAVFPLGGVAYYETTAPELDREGRAAGTVPISRFAFPQDTGGAIAGPGRVDLYAGSGPQAKNVATHQWADGKLYILLKKAKK